MNHKTSFADIRGVNKEQEDRWTGPASSKVTGGSVTPVQVRCMHVERGVAVLGTWDNSRVEAFIWGLQVQMGDS